jgi:hypothetical protein
MSFRSDISMGQRGISGRRVEMRNFHRRRTREWVNLAIKLGLLLTEPKVRAEVANGLNDRADHVTEAIAGRYKDAVDRLEAASDALRGRRDWSSHAVAMLLGIGIGVGVGTLLAPASGEETRHAIRDRVTDMKNKVAESASSAARHIRPVESIPFTGTQG